MRFLTSAARTAVADTKQVGNGPVGWDATYLQAVGHTIAASSYMGGQARKWNATDPTAAAQMADTQFLDGLIQFRHLLSNVSTVNVGTCNGVSACGACTAVCGACDF